MKGYVNQIVGTICGINYGTIKNCKSKVDITGALHYLGGICGKSEGGKIERCINYGELSGLSNIGGICGSCNNSLIECCGNEGTIIESNELVGRNSSAL